MSSCRFHRSIFGLVLLAAALPLSAQQSWHLEVNDDDNYVYLVNDSHKTIEAFHEYARCRPDPNPPFISGASEGGGDSITGTASVGYIRTADGTIPRDAHGWPLPLTGAEPGWRWNTGLFASAFRGETGRCDSDIGVDAVIFTDGSHEGNVHSVRFIQAHRHGFLASVNYWSEKFNKEGASESDCAQFATESKDRVDQGWSKFNQAANAQPDLAHRGLEYSLPMAYWLGRIDADQWVQDRCSSLTGEKAADDYRRYVDQLAQWKKKIEADVSMQKLNAEFPPIKGDSVKPENPAAQQQH